jgi:O-antigen ligase
LRIWEQAIPTIPRYLIIGKGYGIDPQELQAVQAVSEFRAGSDGAGAELAQDYHSGPLSLIIPLGIFGAIGFLWFLGVSLRLLIRNYRYGDSAHHRINTFLLAYFITRTLFFFVIYGSFQNELAVFTGIVALSAAINGGMRSPAPAPAKPNPAYQPFRLPKVARA